MITLQSVKRGETRFAFSLSFFKDLRLVPFLLLIPALLIVVPAHAQVDLFVTDTIYQGNLGGIAGADAKCQARATARGLTNPAEWKAIISDDNVNAIDRFSSTSSGPVHLAKGSKAKLADTVGDMFNGSSTALGTTASVSESGLDYSRRAEQHRVWTGTATDGNKGVNNCSNWTSATFGPGPTGRGVTGSVLETNSRWITDNTAFGCSTQVRLYCFREDLGSDHGDLPGPDIRMFVSSTDFNANLGGLAGADAKCQAAATSVDSQIANAGDSTWKALLSDSNTNARDRITVDSRFVRAADTSFTIAENKAALFGTTGSSSDSTALQDSVDWNELGLDDELFAWTGSIANGDKSPDAGTFCDNWTSTTGVTYGLGFVGEVNNRWINFEPNDSRNCSQIFNLYCFEADPKGGYPSAKHKIATDNNPFLGPVAPDAEDAYQTSSNAGGDDNDTDGDDEGGVSNLTLDDVSGSVNVNIGGSGKLDAFIDFNADGDFSDDGEQIANAEDYSSVTGDTTLTFTNPIFEGEPQGDFIPIIFYTAGKFFSRWRISTVGGLDASADGPQGEVEDHLFVITPTLGIARDSSLTEGDTGTPEMGFYLTLSQDELSNQTVTATATTSDGTATGGVSCTAGVDYIHIDRTVTLNPGRGWALVNVDICGDTVTEGDETFTLTLSSPTNATLGTSSATGTINDDDDPAPTISDVADQTMDEDTTSSPIAFTVADANSDDSALTVTGSSSDTTLLPNSGIVIGPASPTNDSRTVTLTPAADRFGQATVTLTVSDGNSTATDSFILTVNNVNDAPTADDATGTTDEDTPVTDGLTGSDPEGDGLTYVKVSDPANGTATVGGTVTTTAKIARVAAGGSYTYTPNPNFNGTDSFTYKVTDGNGGESAAATVTITVNPVNDGPSADAQSVTGAQDEPLVGMLTGSDPDADSLTFAKASDPANGTVMVNGNGSFTYTPDSGFFGGDSFTFTATDGTATSAAATVTITVQELKGVSLSVDETKIKENGGVATLTVSLDEARDKAIDISLVINGTATRDADFSLGTSKVTILAGETSSSTTVTGLDDQDDEATESVIVGLTSSGHEVIIGITDDDKGALDASGDKAGKQNIRPGAQQVVMATFGIENDNDVTAFIQQVKATLIAENASLADIARMRLYLDINNNRKHDKGDIELFVTDNIPTDGMIDEALVPAFPIPANTTVRFIITVDFKTTIAQLQPIMMAGGLMMLPLIGMVGMGRRKRLLPVVVLCALILGVSGCDNSGSNKKSGGGSSDGSGSTGTSSTYGATDASMTGVDADGKPLTVKVVDVKGSTVSVK